MGKYVQYGCGLSAPADWINFDASPTLRIQKIPIIGKLIVRNRVLFPDNVRYGNVLKGFPGIETNSCDGIYCSHILEHLSLEDFRIALHQTFTYLKTGGIFRCVVPDFEFYIQEYNKELVHNKQAAAFKFMEGSMLGLQHRPNGLKGLILSYFGNSHHLWMWDQYSLADELSKVGFSSVRVCHFNDSKDTSFKSVEEQSRFINAVAIECIK